MVKTKTLILTEKPSVARDFARALNVSTSGKNYFEGNDYVITWAIGHLLTPLNPDDYNPKWKKWSLSSLPIIPDKMEYRPISKVRSQLTQIKKLLSRKDVTNIIVATDAGREGELIARTILGYSKAKHPGKRFWTSEALSTQVITRQLNLARPLKEYDRLFIAGKARQFADWLVGMNLSRLATLKLGELYSIGRVQTAVLALLVDRRTVIDAFVSKSYWNVKIDASSDQGSLSLIWYDVLKGDDATVVENRELAESILNRVSSENGIVKSYKQKDRSESPPHLFSLTDLQREANKRYSFPAMKTSTIAQSLYERFKCLSYPRTDSQHMAKSSVDLVLSSYKKLLSSHSKILQCVVPEHMKSSYRHVFDDSKLTDHHALIPLCPYSGQNSDEKKVFELVVERFAMAFALPHLYVDQTVRVRFGTDTFRGKGRRVTEMGWKELIKDKTDQSELPFLIDGAQCQFVRGRVIDKKTTPLGEYNEASLLRDMVNPARLVEEKEHKKLFRGQVGLGTQATRAQIIETLIKRQYIERKRNTLIALRKGCHLISVLRGFPHLKSLTSPSETAEWEIQLDSIAAGNENGLTFVNSVKEFISKSLTDWK